MAGMKFCCKWSPPRLLTPLLKQAPNCWSSDQPALTAFCPLLSQLLFSPSSSQYLPLPLLGQTRDVCPAPLFLTFNMAKLNFVVFLPAFSPCSVSLCLFTVWARIVPRLRRAASVLQTHTEDLGQPADVFAERRFARPADGWPWRRHNRENTPDQRVFSHVYVRKGD